MNRGKYCIRVACFILIYILSLLYAMFIGSNAINIAAIVVTTAILLSFIKLIINVKSVRIGMQRDSSIKTVKKISAEMSVSVENKSIFPCYLCELLFISDHRLGLPGGSLYFTAKARTKKDISFKIDCPYRGLYTLTLTSVRIWDTFGLFYINKKISMPVSVIVLPPLSYIGIHEMPLTSKMQADHPCLVRTVENTDADDLKQYQPQDSLKSIHWKITARLDEMISRTYYNENDVAATFHINLASHGRLEQEDKLMEMAAAIAYYYTSALVKYIFSYPQIVSGQNVITMRECRGENDFADVYMLTGILQFKKDWLSGGEDLALLPSEYENQHSGTFFYFVVEMNEHVFENILRLNINIKNIVVICIDNYLEYAGDLKIITINVDDDIRRISEEL